MFPVQAARNRMPYGGLSLVEQLLQGCQGCRLHQRRSMPHTRHGNQFTPGQDLDHTPSLGLRQDVALHTPYDQGWTCQRLQDGPQGWPWWRTVLHTLLDILAWALLWVERSLRVDQTIRKKITQGYQRARDDQPVAPRPIGRDTDPALTLQPFSWPGPRRWL